MSSITTKKRDSWSLGDDESVEQHDIANVSSGNEHAETKQVFTKTVINVGIVGTKKNPVIRLDLLEFEGRGGRYTSQTYDLTSKHGSLGMFTLLDDYFARRFKLFHSSKSVQSMMLALNDIENKFITANKISLYDYCKMVVGKSAELAKTNGISGKSGDFPLSKGYGISEEVEVFRLSKQLLLKHDSLMLDDIGVKFVELFDKYSDEIKNKKYCSAILNVQNDGTKSFFIDPVVHLPIISYHPKFTESISKVCALILLNCEDSIDSEIDDITSTSLILMPDATVNSLLSVCDEHGILNKNTNIEDLPFVIGEYFRKEFHREDMKLENINSVVGYS